MMANDEKKLAKSSLISLEIDPASILSLSKGVIFDTIVHNVEYTLNNRRTDPLPWKLVGMSLICDPSRNKNYLQKLQKMQCVKSVIRTEIYHSKLVKSDTGQLTTPGRKIILGAPNTRLTGVFICRSIDELLYMEPPNTENVHIVQYKLLCFERIATRELVNGPKLPSIGDRVIKTVFDFEVTQKDAFPRQLLPVAIISFCRENNGDLCSTIRNFLKLDEHKTFDKSYLVTSTDALLDRLREEQERKEDAEAEQERLYEAIQRRQPLADLSKKSTDVGNARPSSMPEAPLRVPPLKIKLSRPEKPIQPCHSIPPIDSKFKCSLKLDRVNLSLYDVINLPSSSYIKPKKSTESSTSSNSSHNKTKSLAISKPYEHNKPLKRLNTTETKKQIPASSNISKEKRSDESISVRSSTSDINVLSVKNKSKQRSISSSSGSPIYRPKPSIQRRTVEKSTKKKIVKRPILPSEYRCSISLPRLDLSMYDLDLSDINTYINGLPIDTKSIITTLSSDSSSSSISISASSEQQTESSNLPVESENVEDTMQPMFLMEHENLHESDEQNLFDIQSFGDIDTNETLPNIMETFLEPDLNEPLSTMDNEVSLPSIHEILFQPINKSLLTITEEDYALPTDDILFQPLNKSFSNITDEDCSLPTNENLSEMTTELVIEAISTVLPTVTEEVQSKIYNEIQLNSTSEIISSTTNDVQMEVTSQVILSTTNDIQIEATTELILSTTNEVPLVITNEVQLEISNGVSSVTTNDVPMETTSEILLPIMMNDNQMESINEALLPVKNDVQMGTTDEASVDSITEVLLSTTEEVVPVVSNYDYMKSISPISYDGFSPELPPLDDDPIFSSIHNSDVPIIDNFDACPQDFLIIVPCSDDEDNFDDDEEFHDNEKNVNNNDTDKTIVNPLSSPSKQNVSSLMNNPLLARVFNNINRLDSDRLSISSTSSSSCSSISTSMLPNQSPQSPLSLTQVLLPRRILNKKQHKSSETIIFNLYNISIPLVTCEPLNDPRLTYRLQAITTDLRWPLPCHQCSVSEQSPLLFLSPTQIISTDRKHTSDYFDPRRDSLKNAILNNIYDRLKAIVPNVFIINSNQFQKLLFEQTIFNTNCSSHLANLLHRVQYIDDTNFFQMLKLNGEFHLSPFLLQMIFN
ncbi:unnamed protein product [Adineta steineri]|uniref:Uncharacterized protein n=2 Tax=Adineta steineri TaxID=433720 RepID=A0A814CV77_9BILA|nr:unnamed protein product [Adineta steineri]